MVIIPGTGFTTLLFLYSFSILSWSGMIGELEKTCRTIGTTNAHINFLTQCLKNKLIPRGFQSKRRIYTLKSEQLENRFARIRMLEQRKYLYGKVDVLEKKRSNILNSIHTQLLKDQFQIDASGIESTDLNDITTDTIDWRNQAYSKRIQAQHKKLVVLKAANPKPSMNFKMDSVLNLSSRDLTETEIKVLARGFNFRPSLPDLPILDYIVAAEAYIKDANLDDVNAALLRNTIVNHVEQMKIKQKYKPARSNMSTEEWKALKSLQNDNSIMIIPADKGNKTIVLDRDLYLSKLEDRTNKHIPVPTDPSIKHEKLLNQALEAISQALPDSRIKDKEDFILRRSDLGKFLTHSAPAPWNHGLMKLHKDGFPLRDISDASQSPGHKLAKTLNKLFTGYTGKSKHHLNSHSDLVDIIKSGKYDRGFGISFDAVELYPSVLIADALQLLEEKMVMDTHWSRKTDLLRSEVLELVNILISTPYFQCELGFFEQAKGTPMGGPLSRLLADLIIENKIKNKIQLNREWRRQFNWVRLVDDTFMNWDDTEERLTEFFEYLNSIYPPIQWTMEREANNKFHVFDIQLIRNGSH